MTPKPGRCRGEGQSTIRLRGSGAVLLAVFLATIATPGPALADTSVADTSVSEHGSVGVHRLLDDSAMPGAFCLYGPVDGTLRTIRARPPIAFAVDRTSGRDSQPISVRARLQKETHLPSGAWGWKDMFVSAVEKHAATDSTSPFVEWAEFPGLGRGHWRVLWEMSWYKPGQPTRVTGASTHQVDTYGRKVGTWVPDGQNSRWCAGTIAGSPAVRVTHGPRTSTLVGLTFDMGGGLTRASDLVAWLIDNNVPATIFPTGRIGTTTAEGRRLLKVFAAHRDLLDVGNHSWDHPDFSTLDPAQISTQLARTEAAVKPLAGSSTKPLFRPPYGRAPDAVKAAVGAAGWTLDITWDTVTTDYLSPSQGGPTADEIVQQVLSKVRPGSIVIMHIDGVHTLDALPAIVAGLRAMGLTPARMQDLLALDL